MKKKLLLVVVALTMTLALTLSLGTLAWADFPLGAVNRTVEVTTGLNPGTYIVHDSFQANSPYGTNRLISANFNWDAATMENYVFDPSLFPNITWHADGFPLRATYRTPVDHMGEMKYLAEAYPDITNLIHVGYTNGIATGTNPTNYNAQPQYRIPLYALEICSAPGVWDGRPATLHQAGNHAGELDSNELCANLAWYLCTQYGTNAQVTNLIDTTRVYILPYTNGDGNMVSFRTAGGNRRTNARGVDLNRNWAYRWGSNNGSSSSPGTSGNYRGASPNSEPETTAISGIYRTDNVVSSVSGHTSGQIVIFAWAFVRNPDDAHPLLTKLAKEQTDLNGHTPQNGNVMYAQSGEINDYLWGSMRALGFTYEYGAGQVISYLGAQTGNNYITCGYLDAAGQPKNMKANYASGSVPAADITAPLVFLSDEHFALGYQDLPARNGLPTGPLNRRVTLAKVQGELNAGLDVSGKIFMSHIPSSGGADIAALLKAQGALGWVVVNTASNGGYGETTPSYSATGFPVAAVLKGYAADIYDHAIVDPTITLTFKADRQDFASVNYQWGRHKYAYMRNMAIAAEYANHIKGAITDVDGNLIPEATLNASLLIEGKIVDLQSNVGNNPTIERPADQQWKELHTPHYDVVGGVYDWSILPSKQSEYADKGWDITASANGKFNIAKNIKFPVDTEIAIARGQDPVIFADPMYQQTVSGVDYILPDAVTTSFDFGEPYATGYDIMVPFSTYILSPEDLTSAKGDVENVTATLGGVSLPVIALGKGNYVAKINTDVPGDYELVLDFDSGLPHSAYTDTIEINKYNFRAYLAEAEITEDTVLLDVVLIGDINYTQFNASIAYDAEVLQFAGFENLNGVAAEVKKDGADKISVRSVPVINMLTGAPCVEPVTVVTLKFAILDEESAFDAIFGLKAIVNAKANVASTTAPGKPFVLTVGE